MKKYYEIKFTTDNINKIIEQLINLKDDYEFNDLKHGESYLYYDLDIKCEEE